MFGAGESHYYLDRKPVLLLDLDGTLMPTSHIERQAIKAAGVAIRQTRVPLVLDSFQAAFKSVRDRLLDRKQFNFYSGSEKDHQALMRQTLRRAGLSLPQGREELAVARATIALRQVLADSKIVRPFAGYEAVLKDLRKHGVRFYLVTAGDRKEQVAKLKAIGLHSLIPQDRVLVSEGTKKTRKDTAFHGRVISAIRANAGAPARVFDKIRDPIPTARKYLKKTKLTFYMVGDHPEIDVANFLKLAPADTPALRSIRVRRGKWRTRIPASGEHMSGENLNHVRLLVYSNHGIQASVYPPGIKPERER